MFRLLPPIVLALALVTIPIGASADDAANEALARRFYVSVNDRAFDRFEEFVAADFVDHTGNEEGGAIELRRRMEALANEMSDVRLSIELILPSGDYVTVVATARGTSGGAMPADQRLVVVKTVDVWLIRDGMLSELWRGEQR